jgi:ribose 5-phosphate isomerase A
MTKDEAKLLVARRAVELVSDGMKVGLGTGSTATLFIHELGKAVQGGLRIEAIATSDKSSALAKEVGIPLTNFDDTPVLDVNVDGADEVAPGLALIKGGHGAHLREKIVASAAERFVVLAVVCKVVSKLGKLVRRQLNDLGLNPVIRSTSDGKGPWITDEGNVILDCHCGVIEEPEELASTIRDIVGVVEHGLFLGMATLALVASENGVRELRP